MNVIVYYDKEASQTTRPQWFIAILPTICNFRHELQVWVSSRKVTSRSRNSCVELFCLPVIFRRTQSHLETWDNIKMGEQLFTEPMLSPFSLMSYSTDQPIASSWSVYDHLFSHVLVYVLSVTPSHR
jgi:hypothetical protein